MTANNSIDEVFRAEWSRLVAVLVRDFGDLELAEDCAQDAFAQANQKWGSSVGVPDKPAAWLTTTARRKALDTLRRSSTYKDKLAEIEVRARRGPERTAGGELIDERLTLLLGCCHPALNLEAQVALTLRLVAGLTTRQIARAFLIEEDTMGKRISRAKAKIRQAAIPFDPVDAEVLRYRLAAVQHVIYLIFNEGHSSHGDEALVRGDLCDEAVWLAGLLARLVPEDAEVHGLHSLILLIDARRSTRVDAEGLPILLEDQDRCEWDRVKIEEGLSALGRAIEKGPVGGFGLQALLASLHATARTFAATDWARIVSTYDLLLEVDDTPVVRLNRAIALSYAEGPQAGLDAIDPLKNDLDGYVYLHSATAELLHRVGDDLGAIASFERSLECAPSEAERKFLERRLNALGA